MRTYLRLFRFGWPHRWLFVGALALMLVLGATTAAYAQLLGPALDFLFTGRTSSMAALARVVPRGLHVESWLAAVDRHQLLAVLPFVIFGVALAKGLAYFGQQFLMGLVSQRIVADLRHGLFAKLVGLPPAFHARHHSGDLLSRFTTDVQMVQLAVTDAVSIYLRDGITLVAMLASCFALDWKLSLVVFGAVPVTLYPVVRIARLLRRFSGATMAGLGEISELAVEALSGVRVVQAFGMERWEEERFRATNAKMMRFERHIFTLRAFSSPLMEVMGAAGIAASIWWVGGQILDGRLDPGKFFSFMAAVLLLYQPVKQIGRVGQMAIIGAAAGHRVFEILDAVDDVRDDGRTVLPPFASAIRYEAVDFAYGDRPVLAGFDLEIPKGSVVALVGASGGGKTTIANLLPRFWDPTGGRITIDGVDLRDATKASLRAQLAVVTQETILFNDTVRANIAYGRPDLPLEAVERAARMAQAHEFISQLPQGYDTRLGERGVILSGGQRQRIAIARAFMKDAPILILDEATSALDSESEREVQRALDRLMELEGGRHRTTLVIAHRLSTIRAADAIVVISGGRVVEAGTHDALMAREGEYARLWRIFEGADQGGAGAPATVVGAA